MARILRVNRRQDKMPGLRLAAEIAGVGFVLGHCLASALSRSGQKTVYLIFLAKCNPLWQTILVPMLRSEISATRCAALLALLCPDLDKGKDFSIFLLTS
jgi:hypothetical protein